MEQRCFSNIEKQGVLVHLNLPLSTGSKWLVVGASGWAQILSCRSVHTNESSLCIPLSDRLMLALPLTLSCPLKTTIIDVRSISINKWGLLEYQTSGDLAISSRKFIFTILTTCRVNMKEGLNMKILDVVRFSSVFDFSFSFHF